LVVLLSAYCSCIFIVSLLVLFFLSLSLPSQAKAPYFGAQLITGKQEENAGYPSHMLIGVTLSGLHLMDWCVCALSNCHIETGATCFVEFLRDSFARIIRFAGKPLRVC
jgi:hypothetical protein